VNVAFGETDGTAASVGAAVPIAALTVIAGIGLVAAAEHAATTAVAMTSATPERTDRLTGPMSGTSMTKWYAVLTTRLGSLWRRCHRLDGENTWTGLCAPGSQAATRRIKRRRGVLLE
jgi:hypothetical protein